MPEYPFPPPSPFSWELLIVNCTLLLVLLTSVLMRIVFFRRQRPSGSHVAAWMAGFGLATGLLNSRIATSLSEANLALEWFNRGVFGLWFLLGVGTAISLARWIYAERVDVPSLPAIASVMLFFVLLVAPYAYAGVTTPREASKRMQCRNNLKQIGLAIHLYHDDFHAFPAGQLLAEPHSWRVDLLPYLYQQGLYQQYRLDETWDGEHNLALQPNRPMEYACPSFMKGDHAGDLSSLSSYVALTGPGTLYDAKRPALTFSEVGDGASQTLAIVEACGLRRIWTDPSDADVGQLPMGINRPGRQRGTSEGILSSYHPKGAHGLMLDGSVRFLAEGTDPRILDALATSQRGEDVPDSSPW